MPDDAPVRVLAVDDERPAELPRSEPERPVCCRACGHALSRRALAIEVGGAHEHTFRNPAGYSFHLLCYADAPGCAREGTPTAEASWFAGQAWCFALCARCGVHVGWHYRRTSVAAAPVERFYGLIATRLAR